MFTVAKAAIKSSQGWKGKISGKAFAYYSQVDDYYASESEGFWVGSAANKLGLTGEVQAQDFYAALHGQVNGINLRHRTIKFNTSERLAHDGTFSAPKSVSIQAVVGGDKRLVKLHEEAVRMAFAELEKHVSAIKKTENQRQLVYTNNLAAAAFTHTLARASKDAFPDPQLHTHCLILNTTDRGNGDWGAITDSYFMYEKAREVGTQYRVFLAKLLLENGYELRQSKYGFELAHISEDMIREFSKRNKEINNSMKERGLKESTPKQRDVGALATRQNKDDFDLSELRQEWTKTVEKFMSMDELKKFSFKKSLATSDDTKSNSEEAKPNDQTVSDEEKQQIALDAVKWAVGHLEERNGLFAKREIEKKALELSMFKGVDADLIKNKINDAVKEGLILPEAKTYVYPASALKKHPLFDPKKADFSQPRTIESWIKYLYETHRMTYKDIFAQLQKDMDAGVLKAAEQRYASSHAVIREASILEMELNGRHALLKPVLSKRKAGRILDKVSLPDGSKLSAEQKEAALLMLTTRARFVGIQGYAGTGKSHTFSVVQKTLKENRSNFRIVGFAPKRSQALALKELEMEANTVALLLNSKKLQDSISSDDILLIDEAGTLSTKDTESLMKLAIEKNARLVLVGDTKQTYAVEAGKPFELLQKNGMPTAGITDIQRQRNEYNRKAVQMAAEGNLSESLFQLRHGEAVQLKTDGMERTIYFNEISDENERLNAIADFYTPLSADEKRNTLILTATNRERTLLNEIIREKEGIKNEIKIQVLNSLDRTEHELKSSYSYYKQENETGRFVVEFFRDSSQGFNKGSSYYVESIDDKQNKIRLQNVETGELKWFDLSKKADFVLYEQNEISIGTGDKIRITKNNVHSGLSNGDLLNVTAVDGRLISTDKGTLQVEELNHFTHAYAHSIYSSQGYTSKNVIVNFDTKSKAIYDATYYVAISRNREKFYMFTNDKSNLYEAVKKKTLKYNALDMAKNSRKIETEYQPTYGRKRFSDYFKKLPEYKASEDLNKAIELRNLIKSRQESLANRHKAEHEVQFSNNQEKNKKERRNYKI